MSVCVCRWSRWKTESLFDRQPYRQYSAFNSIRCDCICAHCCYTLSHRHTTTDRHIYRPHALMHCINQKGKFWPNVHEERWNVQAKKEIVKLENIFSRKCFNFFLVVSSEMGRGRFNECPVCVCCVQTTTRNKETVHSLARVFVCRAEQVAFSLFFRFRKQQTPCERLFTSGVVRLCSSYYTCRARAYNAWHGVLSGANQSH